MSASAFSINRRTHAARTAHSLTVPGAGRAFDGFDAMTIAMHLTEPVVSSLTVEYWVNMLDPHLQQATLFGYSAYSVTGRFGDGGPIYENANEFTIMHASTYTRLFHSTSSYDFDSATQVYADSGNWTHVALVWSSDPDAAPHGQLAYYANGRLVASGTQCASRECDMGFPVQPYGVLHLGQEADKPWGDFDELQAFTGLVDEVRVWTSARTDEQILVHAP